MEQLKKEERSIGYIMRKTGGCLLIAFFIYTYPGLLIVRKLFESDLEIRPETILFSVIYLAASIAVICRIIIVLTGRYMSVPVLHKYLSRREVRQLFENEHFEEPAELKGTLFEGHVCISEHWLCMYHHFVRRDKTVFVWKTSRGAYTSFQPLILNVLYGSGDAFHFDGEDWRHFDKKWDQLDLFWYYLVCHIAGGTERSCRQYLQLRKLTEACRRNCPTRADRKNYFLTREGLKADADRTAKLYAEIDLEHFAFLKCIDQAVCILFTREKDDEYAPFHERYEEMRNHLERLRSDIVKKNDHCEKTVLRAARMVKHGDDEKLKNAIAAVEHYYFEDISRDRKTAHHLQQ